MARVLLGAIRWDPWNSISPYGTLLNTVLGPNQWHTRLPYYGIELDATHVDVLHEDDAGNASVECLYAAYGGIDYFMFAPILGYPGFNRCFEQYLALPRTSTYGVRFCDCLQQIVSGAQGGPNTWATQVLPMYLSHFADPRYVKVVGNRPLMYIFLDVFRDTYWGGDADLTKGALDDLREGAVALGLGEPYFVHFKYDWLVSGPELTTYNLQAIGTYGWGGGGAEAELPYADLAAGTEYFSSGVIGAGYPCVPLATAAMRHRGWHVPTPLPLSADSPPFRRGRPSQWRPR